ncbi:MAG: hypothetical protein JXA64_08600 [Candidatus Fermentibacteraceae bacterium]|nr:hypothetical protein [Candidatus Fermentibacteraceae bacterium]
MTGADVGVSIAGIRIALHGSDPVLESLKAPRYSDFICSAGDADIRLSIFDEPVDYRESDLPGNSQVFDSGTVWSLYKTQSHMHILLRSPGHGGAPYRMATFDRDLTRGEIVTFRGPGTEFPPEEHDPLEFPLSEVLMVCLLARGRGVMVHACGLDDLGRGLLFPGNSTDGKSTMAGLWKGSARILNDDRIILRESEGAIRMYGTPWHGDMSDVSAEGTGLSSVYFLFHGSSNSVRSVSGAKAISMLLRRSFLPLWSRTGMEYSMDFLHSVAEQVPFHELDFVPDAGIVDFLKCGS